MEVGLIDSLLSHFISDDHMFYSKNVQARYLMFTLKITHNYSQL